MSMEFFQVPRSHGTFIPTFASHTREGVSDGSTTSADHPRRFQRQRFGLPGEERRRKLAEREARAWGTQSGVAFQ